VSNASIADPENPSDETITINAAGENATIPSEISSCYTSFPGCGLME
jgi:hypothetical protein